MRKGLLISALVLCSILALGNTAFGAPPTGPIPMQANFRDHCRPTVSPRDCYLGLPEKPDRVGSDFQGGYTEQVTGVESVITPQGNYHLQTNAYGSLSYRRLWLEFSDGGEPRPFVTGYTKDASLTTGGTIPSTT
jgi:hypothetical protein